jgi:hypothetical protein
MISRTLAGRAALLAACAGATAALGAAPAGAVTKVPGENIFGSGSSLQAVAEQNVWTVKFHAPLNTADRPTLSNDPTVTYTATSSGHGLAEFGNTTGALDLTQDATANNGATNGYGVPVLDAYAGSDDPPTSSNLTNASAAATGSATTAISEITVPIAQAPVAIVVSLPSGITVGPKTKLDLSTSQLTDIWNANVPASTDYPANTWGAVLENAKLVKVASAPKLNQFTDAGGATGGTQAITLQVRSGGSGTSYTFKGFLNMTGDPLYTSTFVTDSPTWPVTVQSTGNGTGGQLAQDTENDPGSIGYANLADARGTAPAYTNLVQSTSDGGTTHQVLWAQIQDNEGHAVPKFSDPQSTGTTVGTANVYTGNNLDINGSNSNFVGQWTVPLSGSTFVPTGSWGGTNPSDPDVYDHGVKNGIKTAYYPIVATTYDLGWTDYDEAGSNLVADYGGTATDATEAGNSANAFLNYEVSPKTGQKDIVAAKKNYAALPAGIDTYAVLAAAATTP